MTERELLNVLERHGIKRIQPMNEPFNPHLHQAVMEMPAHRRAGRHHRAGVPGRLHHRGSRAAAGHGGRRQGRPQARQAPDAAGGAPPRPTRIPRRAEALDAQGANALHDRVQRQVVGKGFLRGLGAGLRATSLAFAHGARGEPIHVSHRRVDVLAREPVEIGTALNHAHHDGQGDGAAPSPRGRRRGTTSRETPAGSRRARPSR